MKPVITEFNFVIDHSETWESDPIIKYRYKIDPYVSYGHKLRVISQPDKSIDEAIEQFKGMIRCLEELKKLPN